jgi:hypothetical protein
VASYSIIYRKQQILWTEQETQKLFELVLKDIIKKYGRKK